MADNAAPVVSVRGLSKGYNVYAKPRDMVVEALFGGVRHDVFWALNDVTFDVAEGDRVGILGPNGAGKTTLLRIVAGNLTASSGSATVDGRVSALLSLTSALNPSASGLENIRFHLTLNGVPRHEVPPLTEEIVEFSELGSFIHAPVRTYSSGMSARLAFSIATAITPDVLVVDEVLGAGDAYFAAKAMLRMIDLCNDGRCLLFVSHATAMIQLLCDRAIWLDSGAIRAMGPVDEIVTAYEADFRRQEDDRVRRDNAARNRRFRGKVRIEDVQIPGALRLRLIGDGGRLTDTHYVRRVSVDRGDGPRDVSLYLDSLDASDAGATLDLLHSEWGRPHMRRGIQTRALASSSHALRGGHIVLKAPPSGQSSKLRLVVESTSLQGVERLVLERADLATGDWAAIEPVKDNRLRDGWHRSSFETSLDPLDGDAHDHAIARIIEESRPEVEIVDVSMHVKGRKATVVRERQPFTIDVVLRAHRRVPCADVHLRITRRDGVYIFWQSSGQVGKNLIDLDGPCAVTFRFDPNIFGGAEYDVRVDVGNGYDIEHNFPHSQIFDRCIKAMSFTVKREWKLYDTPPVNHRFPVEVVGANTSSQGIGGARSQGPGQSAAAG